MFLTHLLVKNYFISVTGFQRRTMKGIKGLYGPDSSNIHGFSQPRLETSASTAGAGGMEPSQGQTDLFMPLAFSSEREVGDTPLIQEQRALFREFLAERGMNSSAVSLSPSGTGTVTLTLSPSAATAVAELPSPSVFMTTPGYSLHAEALTRKLELVTFEQGREALMSTVVSTTSTTRPKVFELSTVFKPWLGELLDIGTEVEPLQDTQRLVLPEPATLPTEVNLVPRHLVQFRAVPLNFSDPLVHIETPSVPTAGEFMPNSRLVNTFDGVPPVAKPDMAPVTEQQQSYTGLVQQQEETDAVLAANANNLLEDLEDNAAEVNEQQAAGDQLAAEEKLERDLGAPFSFQRFFKYFTGYTLDPEKVQTYGRIAGVTVGLVVMVGGYLMYNRLPSVGNVSGLLRLLASLNMKSLFTTATTTVGKVLEKVVAQSNWEETLGTVRTKATAMTTLVMAKFTAAGQAYFAAKAKRKASLVLTKFKVYNFMADVLTTTLNKVWGSKK